MIRLGTRSSALALAQARAAAERLRRLGAEVDLVPMKTEGDRLFGALTTVGGKGLFVREIEQGLLDGRVDAAVHSLKDLPAEVPPGLELAAFVEREDPRDVLVTRTGGGLEDLPPGAVVGTGSLRRRAMVLAQRPDLVVEPIRGNIDTRLGKLDAGAWDAVILAAAGLARLGLRPAHAVPLPPEVFVPAAGQGIVALEVRRDDPATAALVAALDHPDTRAAALAERACLWRLGASCLTPMAAHATVTRSGRTASLILIAAVASEDGRRILRVEAAGAPHDAAAIGREVGESLLAQGAEAVAHLGPARRSP